MPLNPGDKGLVDEDEELLITPPDFLTPYRDFYKRPCLRSSMIWSLNLSIGFGLAQFMLTSNASKSIAYSGLAFSTSLGLIYIGCIIKHINDKVKVRQLEPVLQSYAEMYGTDKDKRSMLDKLDK